MSVQTLLGPSRTISAGVLVGANLNGGYASFDNAVSKPALIGGSIGIGITLGAAYGVGETRLGWTPFTPKTGN